MTIKVISLNVWNGGLIFEPMVEFLQKEQADIYLLQEVFDSQESDAESRLRTYQILSEKLDAPYRHFAPCFVQNIQGIDVTEGNAIFSKFPLEEASVTFFDVPFGRREEGFTDYARSPRNLQYVTAKMEQKELHVFNIHGIWGEDGLDNERRIEMGRRIVQEIGDHQPAILAGDFNVSPNTKTIDQIEEKLTSIFKDELTTSFNILRKDIVKFPGYATSVVDMMLISSDIKVVDHHCPQVDVSDHLPLVATLELS